MIKSRTYDHSGTSVTITVDIHSGIIDMGGGSAIPTNEIKYTVGEEDEQTYGSVRDEELERKLMGLESALNRHIDGTPNAVLESQLTAMGYE